MGTLNVNTIADAGGGSNVGVQGEGTATTNLSQGLAKSWFNMSAGATPRDSLNVTSFTDNQTGDDTLTVTSNFSNDDFAAITAGWRDHDAASLRVHDIIGIGPMKRASARQYLPVWVFHCLSVPIKHEHVFQA